MYRLRLGCLLALVRQHELDLGLVQYLQLLDSHQLALAGNHAIFLSCRKFDLSLINHLTSFSRPSSALKTVSTSATRTDFEEGDVVKVKRAVGTGAAEATIVKKNKDLSYNVRYSASGRAEMNVPYTRIMSTGANTGSNNNSDVEESKSSSAGPKAPPMKMGTQIEANVNGDGWVKGMIVSDNPDGTYDIRFPSGREAKKVPRDRIKLFSASAVISRDRKPTASDDEGLVTFKRLEKVEVRKDGNVKWFPATVQTVNLDGSYDVRYDDGGREYSVNKKLIRRAQGFESESKAIADGFGKSAVRLEEGSKVEANYGGKGRFFPGKITRVRADGTFDILYDDGDSETRVK
ncbi:hypothetical protein EON65_07405, partial [archaeon]